MTQYISKSALVAELERRKKYYENIQMIKPVYENNIEDFNELLSFLDTIEVKEVDLDSDIRTYLTNHFNIYEDGVLQSKKSGLPLRTYDIIKVAEHFFELALSLKNS